MSSRSKQTLRDAIVGIDLGDAEDLYWNASGRRGPGIGPTEDEALTTDRDDGRRDF